MIHNLLMVVSAVIIALLGTGHLLLTLRGPKLLPRDRELRAAMENTHPVITTQTTMWRAWYGFNISHSMGAIMFGFFYGYLALVYPEVLFGSWPLLGFGLITLLAYLVLAKRYWFITPLMGISLALACYVLSVLVSLA